MTFPKIASHRGGAQLWPENSLTAFAGTAKLPVDLVEFDVQRTADGALVVFHDATLDRVTDGQGPLAERSLAELRALRILGTADTIPTLDEVLALFAPTPIGLRIEIKPAPGLRPFPGIEAEVAGALRAAGLLARAQVTSFLRPTLSRFRAAAEPGLGLVWLLSDQVAELVGDDAALCRLTRAAGADAMSMRVGLLSPARVAAAAGEGVALSAYAAHDLAEIAHAAACGVAVFTTDRPDLALRARAAAAA